YVHVACNSEHRGIRYVNRPYRAEGGAYTMRSSKAGSPARPSAHKAKAVRPGAMAFRKFMSVLQHVADAQERQTVADVGKAVGLPRPTVYRILAGLEAEGLIAESIRDKTFSLGPRLIALARRSWETSDLRSVALQELPRLRDTVGETVHLAVPSG